MIDFDAAPVFALPALDAHGRHIRREGVLVEGPQGWGEYGPAPDDDADTLARWLTAAVETGTVGWPDPVRGQIPIAVTVPSVDAAEAHRLATESGCAVAEVTVGDGALSDDLARVEAVRDALGPTGAIRCHAHAGWSVEAAMGAIAELERASSGLEFVVQPCSAGDLAALRRRIDLPVAAPGDLVARSPESADIAVLATGPMGGVRRALRVAEKVGLPCVVASSWESSIGLAGGLALAGALPELPFACALGTRLLMGADLVAHSRQLVPVDGLLPVAPMPAGPDAELLARYAITDEQRVAWWRNRLSNSGTGVR